MVNETVTSNSCLPVIYFTAYSSVLVSYIQLVEKGDNFCSDLYRYVQKLLKDIIILHVACVLADYYRRLLSTTAIALQEGKPITLLVLIPVLLLVIICMIVTIVVITCWYRYRHKLIRQRKRYKFPGHRNTEREFTVTKFQPRHRVNRHSSVQETRDPSKQEGLSPFLTEDCSLLFIFSNCKRLVLGLAFSAWHLQNYKYTTLHYMYLQ